MPSQVLVTGASGFVGAQIVTQLLAKGYRVRGTVRSVGKPSNLEAFNHLELFSADLHAQGAFDTLFFNYTPSLSPGVEQVSRWGSAARDKPGTFNYAGVASPAVDAMITAIIGARTQPEFVEAVRAYDRVLLSGAYVIPLYFKPEQWIAHWKRIERPEIVPLQGSQLPTWWRAED